MTKSNLLLTALFCLAAGQTQAQSSADELGQRLVDDFVNNVITMEGNFEQSLIDAEGTVIDRSSGTLEIERPTRFRWSYSDPYEQWLVADGLNIWSYDLDLEQVTVKPQAEALANTPALLLGGSEDALDQFDYGGTTIETITTWVRLEPKDKSSGFNRVELGFINEQLRRMIFYDNLEQTTFIALDNVRINEPIEDDRFRFVVPTDVDLVGIPVVADVATP